MFKDPSKQTSGGPEALYQRERISDNLANPKR